MRHGEVAYFDEAGQPVPPDDVALTAHGREQARAAAAALAGVAFDRVLSSGLPRTVETARIVAGREPETWPELREIQGADLRAIPEDELEHAFVDAFRGVVPNDARFLGGESYGELFDRVLPALERLLADGSWDTALAVLHGAVNRAILSYALTAERMFLGHFEQAPACINVLDVGDAWIVRAVNVAPYGLIHAAGRGTTMKASGAQSRP